MVFPDHQHRSALDFAKICFGCMILSIASIPRAMTAAPANGLYAGGAPDVPAPATSAVSGSADINTAIAARLSVERWHDRQNNFSWPSFANTTTNSSCSSVESILINWVNAVLSFQCTGVWTASPMTRRHPGTVADSIRNASWADTDDATADTH